jgi:D-beta-D-heptose 7-phosphate kinase/D-beta-D-heptose 1-phosphate adenosyltransferase
MDKYYHKIKTLKETKTQCDQLKASEKKIVFTNGCFDILHPGHTRYLFAARELGNYLVVAVNSDRSIRAIKGSKRPILNEKIRAELVAALSCVDCVLIFDEDNPLETDLIKKIISLHSF